MAIIERMEPIAAQSFESFLATERGRQLGEVRTLYRLNYMGQTIEGLTRQDLIKIATAIYENQQYLR